MDKEGTIQVVFCRELKGRDETGLSRSLLWGRGGSLNLFCR